MTKEIDIFQRLAKLEANAEHTREELREKASENEMEELKEEIIELKQRLSYYDKLAVKWGIGCMAVLTMGALAGSNFDKFKEKLIAWFLS